MLETFWAVISRCIALRGSLRPGLIHCAHILNSCCQCGCQRHVAHSRSDSLTWVQFKPLPTPPSHSPAACPCRLVLFIIHEPRASRAQLNWRILDGFVFRQPALPAKHISLLTSAKERPGNWPWAGTAATCVASVALTSLITWKLYSSCGLWQLFKGAFQIVSLLWLSNPHWLWKFNKRETKQQN